jgi:hypothetical protein
MWQAWSFFEPGDLDAEDWVAARAADIVEGRPRPTEAGPTETHLAWLGNQTCIEVWLGFAHPRAL